MPVSSVVKFKTSPKFEEPPVRVELLIVILEKSASQELSIPAVARAFINPSMVILVVTLIVLVSPLALKMAVPLPESPNVPNVVAVVAFIVLVTLCDKALVREYADATLIWSVEIVPAPYKHSSKFVPCLYLLSVSAIVLFAIRAKTSASVNELNAPPVISKIPVSVSNVE